MARNRMTPMYNASETIIIYDSLQGFYEAMVKLLHTLKQKNNNRMEVETL